MIELALMPGFFALACTIQDTVPLTGTAVGPAHTLSLVARDGKGVMTGWTNLGSQVAVRKAEDGIVVLNDITFTDSDEAVWAVLRPSKTPRAYEMEWLMYDQQSRDGSQTVAVWAKGHCDQLGADQETMQ